MLRRVRAFQMRNQQTSNTFSTDSTSYLFRHGQCIYVQYLSRLTAHPRRVGSPFLRSVLFHYGIFTFSSQECQRHLKAAIHLQMASVKRAPFPASHVAVARSSVMEPIPFARDALRWRSKLYLQAVRKISIIWPIIIHRLTDLSQSAIYLSHQEAGEPYSGA